MIYFLIPVYNEEENIDRLAKDLLGILPQENKFYVFVNDCSTDNTVQAIQEHFPAQQLNLVRNPNNSGPGYSFNAGFEWILKHSQSADDLIITLEGDNTSDIGILSLMFSLAKDWNYDLVLASVYAQGGGFTQTSFLRKIISLIANQIFRSIYGIKVLTLTSFYRVYRISLICKIKQKYSVLIKESGFICKLELLVKSIHVGARIIEVPMTLKTERRAGKSKMKIVSTGWSYLKFLLRKDF